MLQGLPPIMCLTHSQGTMIHIAMRLLALGFNAGWIDRVIIEFNLTYDSFKLGAVDGGPSILLQGLCELWVIVGVDVGLLCDSEQVGVSCLSGDGGEWGELWGWGGLVYLDAEGFVDSLTLGSLQGFDSFAALVLLAGL